MHESNITISYHWRQFDRINKDCRVEDFNHLFVAAVTGIGHAVVQFPPIRLLVRRQDPDVVRSGQSVCVTACLEINRTIYSNLALEDVTCTCTCSNQHTLHKTALASSGPK